MIAKPKSAKITVNYQWILNTDFNHQHCNYICSVVNKYVVVYSMYVG